MSRNQESFYEILLPLAFNQNFTYKSSERIKPQIGDVVLVSFRQKEILGVVIKEVREEEITFDTSKIKEIIQIHKEIKFSDQLLEFVEWIAAYNLASRGLVLKSFINTLSDFKLKDFEKPILEQKIDSSKFTLKILSKQQQEIADELLKNCQTKKHCVSLIDGVTGSGKTEIYFFVIKYLLENTTDQILILLPEIALTSQLLSRFEKQFGFAPYLWHSKIGKKSKKEIYSGILKGSVRIIIGARSSLLLPFKNLKLIIVDEEHDSSLKQEDSFNFNARDMAIVKGKIDNFQVILSSATPSLESYLNAKNGKYSLVKLEQRFGQEEKTKIKLLDMRQEKMERNHFISNFLKQELANNLQNGKQSLLFLNRRGYAPLTLCSDCGYKITCPNCSSHITLHQKINRLVCHHCGLNKKPTNKCFNCKKENSLINCGVGVEKLQEEVLKYFPEARIGLVSSDVVKNISDAEHLIDKIINHKIDIIIGTQMIAKGHHFPSLALVGIVEGDASFLGGGLRTAERSFQLLTQVIGRAGREHYQGQVILQTYNPENIVFKNIIENDRDLFLENEIQNRQILNFPPFSKMASLIFSGLQENSVIETAKMVLKEFPIDSKIEIFGPAPMPITRIKNRFHYCLNVKVDKGINLQKLIIKTLEKLKIPSTIRLRIDIDPN